MTDFADVIEWARGSSRPAGQCQGFVANDMTAAFGSFQVGYDTARDAMNASGPLSPDYPGVPSFAWFDTSADGHVGFGTPDAILQDAPGLIDVVLNARGTVGYATLASMQRYATFLGWSRTNGANTMPILTVNGVTPAPAPATPTVTGWQVGQTDFQGTYGENNLNGARWYCIEPTTSSSKTIYAICQQYGINLEDARAWTAKVAGSRWAGALLQAGSAWWDGSDNYYAGQCVALNDVAAQLDAYDAQVTAAQQASVDAEKARIAAVSAQITADNAAGAHEQAAENKAAQAPETVPSTLTAAQSAQPEVPALTAEQLAAYAAKLQPLPTGSLDADPSAPLSGLLAGKPRARKRAYYAYATAALVVSFGPDIVTAGILADVSVPTFVAYVSLATSILLKVGTAFGFVAASNVK